MLKRIFWIFIISLVLFGCEKKSTYQDIIDNGNAYILDVRTPEEYKELHVKDAINIPLDTIDENIDLPKDKTIMVYCKSGVRSNQAYNKLKSYGYDVIDLGGITSLNLEKVTE